MVVNFIRHGNRTPGKIYSEIKDLFYKMDQKKLTINGFKQMNLLGKHMRKRLINNRELDIDLDKISHQYLIISSPQQRSIDSSIAYSLGLFPEKMFKIYDMNNKFAKKSANPPIIKTLQIPEETFQYYNLIIENKSLNTLFHAKKCKFDDYHYYKQKPKDFKHLSEEEKLVVYDFLTPLFPDSMKNFNLQTFNDKMARSLYTAMKCVNKHYIKRFVIPEKIENILQRLMEVYNYFVKVSDDFASKVLSSAFFHQLIKLFDNKIKMAKRDKSIYQRLMEFLSATTSENDEKIELNELPELKDEDFSQLKLVTYSGHHGNLTALIRNFLYEHQLLDYFKNFDIYKNLLYTSFASTIDFFLESDKENPTEYYVKIYINGEEQFQKIRSYKEGEYLHYKKGLGIPYGEFKKFVESRIYADYYKCKFDN